MQVHHFFNQVLVPSSQLFSGLTGLMRAVLPYRRDRAVATTHAKVHKQTVHLLAALTEEGREALALAAAWLVNGLSKTDDERRELEDAVDRLRITWLNAFSSFSAEIKLPVTLWFNLFSDPSANRLPSSFYKSLTVRDHHVHAHLEKLCSAQIVLVSRIHAVLDYRTSERLTWLRRNVNHQHLLTKRGQISRWRTLEVNSSMYELAKFLVSDASDTVWRQPPLAHSAEGRDRLPSIYLMLQKLGSAAPSPARAEEAPCATGAVPGLLPDNYSIEKLPSGALKLTVQLQLLSTLLQSVSATEPSFKEFLRMKVPEARELVSKSSRYFCGTLFEGKDLFERAQNWERSRTAEVQQLAAQYDTFRETHSREVLRAKLNANFSVSEQKLLREMMSGSGFQPA